MSCEGNDEGNVPSASLKEYDYADAEPACSTEYLLPVIRKLLEGLPQGAVIADLGCGNGSFIAQFRGRGWQLHGLELSETGLAQARRAFPEIRFHVADLAAQVEACGLGGQCDIVLSTEVIEHVFLPRQFVRNCRRLLKPNGTLILSTPYHGYLKNLFLAISGRLDNHFTALWDFGHIKFWSKRTLTQLLREAGFEITAFHGAGRLPFLWKSIVVIATQAKEQDVLLSQGRF